MLIKQHYNQNFYHLFGELFKANNKKNEQIFFKTTKNNKLILNILLTEGYILSYKIYKDFIYIRFKNNGSIKNTRTLNSFINIKKSVRIKQKNNTVSLKDLLKLQKREGNITNYLLNTDKGLLTSQEAINKRIGGKILIKII